MKKNRDEQQIISSLLRDVLKLLKVEYTHSFSLEFNLKSIESLEIFKDT